MSSPLFTILFPHPFSIFTTLKLFVTSPCHRNPTQINRTQPVSSTSTINCGTACVFNPGAQTRGWRDQKTFPAFILAVSYVKLLDVSKKPLFMWCCIAYTNIFVLITTYVTFPIIIHKSVIVTRSLIITRRSDFWSKSHIFKHNGKPLLSRSKSSVMYSRRHRLQFSNSVFCGQHVYIN